MAVAIEHPLLRPDAVQFRGYQANLARVAARRDTMVVLPTGMGKTIVALLALADAWRGGARHILMMAPTRPLVEQHAAFLEGVLGEGFEGAVQALTGHIGPDKRAAAYEAQGIVVATPQVVQNDAVSDRLPGVPDWIVYDECHRAVGDYPYTFLGRWFRRHRPDHRRLGLTASPGHDVAKIDEVRGHLGLDHVEIRTPTDPDVREYIQEVDTEWETLPLPPTMDRVSKRLRDALQQRTKALKRLGFLKTVSGRPGKRVLLDTSKQLQALIRRSSDPDPSWYQALSLQAQAMKLLHALEQVETQGAAAFVQYLENMRKEAEGPKASKASRAIVEDDNVNRAYHVARHDESENPKVGRVEVLVREQVERDPDSRVIVFTHYRNTCESLSKRLEAIDGVRPVVFVGQGKRKGQEGLTQKQQADILGRFRGGDFNTLVATSVAEEGLDIPATDLVVFYEPIPSEIRSIQRRGRTGRNRAGRVVVLMTKGTQDEAAHWSARRKEQQMVRELQGVRATLAGRSDATTTPGGGLRSTRDAGDRQGAAGAGGLGDAGGSGSASQSTLDDASDRTRPAAAPAATQGGRNAGTPRPAPHEAKTDRPVVVCDSREQSGGVVRHLAELGAEVQLRSLEMADFIVSDRIAIERKLGDDFVESLIDGRLFDQVRRLKDYPRPFLVLEGDGLGGRNVSPEAIMGALASVTVDFGVPVLMTRDGLETARFVLAVAKREQIRSGRHVAVRQAPPGHDEDRLSIHVLAGFPGISEARARRLLETFGSLEAVFSATKESLAAVEGIGPKTAAAMRALLDRPFGG